MVVIDDYRKLILYQRLNLGYECVACKRKFYNKREQLLHLHEVHLNPPKKDYYKCDKCSKTFSNEQVFKLHSQIHVLSEVSMIQQKIKEQNDRLAELEEKISVSKTTKANKERQPAPAAKKQVGLTKVKMEDCLRCDACSCIYLDKNDYYKHMRNFHKLSEIGTSLAADEPAHFVLVERPNNSPKKKCRSCCKQCRGNHEPGEDHQHTTSRPLRRGSNTLFQFTMQDNIKDRWSKMVSQRMQEGDPDAAPESQVQIKPDPDAVPESRVQIKPDPDAVPDSEMADNYDISHLLSQVEVKIKTEPMDEQ